MKITYKENPLATTVELNEHEKQIFWYKIKIEELQDELFTGHFHLQEDQFFDLSKARKALDPSFYFKENGETHSKIDSRTNELLSSYLSDLMDSHAGDCTCVACSCGKCHAEKILEIDTLKPYPGKHILVKIYGAFTYKDGEEWKQRSLAEALERLKNYQISLSKPDSWHNFSQADYEKHIPRWTDEARKAYEYLLNYANLHFKGVIL